MIDLFFQLLNFCIIFGLIAYGFIRFFIPAAQKNIGQEKQIESNLHDEHRNILNDQKIVEESTVAQEAECIEFFNRINQWKASVSKEKAVRKGGQRTQEEKVFEKMQLQSHYHTLRVLYHKAVPSVIQKLEQELMTHFQDEKNGHAYIDHVLKGLKK